MATDWGKIDKARRESAIALIGGNEDLRFFIRSILAATGMSGTPEGDNALSTARAIGRHSVGADLIRALIQYDPELYPALIREDLLEQRERGTSNVYSDV